MRRDINEGIAEHISSYYYYFIFFRKIESKNDLEKEKRNEYKEKNLHY